MTVTHLPQVTHERDGSHQLFTGHIQRVCSCGETFMGTAESSQAARDAHIDEHKV